MTSPSASIARPAETKAASKSAGPSLTCAMASASSSKRSRLPTDFSLSFSLVLPSPNIPVRLRNACRRGNDVIPSNRCSNNRLQIINLMAIPSVRALESRARAADGDVTVCDWRSLSFFLRGNMKVTKVHAAVVAALTGVSGLSYQTASAQEGLEEIVVTATRREQNLQEVPISIVAITGEGLETRGIDNLEEVSQSVPNVIITGGTGGTGGTSFRMRGIPNVGTYVDGVWQVGTAGFLTQEFVDIDRVEVLRGPQGTMFGRDSTGGAIRIWTQRPAADFGGNVTVTAGSLDRRRRQGVARYTSRRENPYEVDGREPVPRRLHQQPDHGHERRRHRSASAARRHYLGRHGQSRLPLQLPERREHLHRAARDGRHVPHVRRSERTVGQVDHRHAGAVHLRGHRLPRPSRGADVRSGAPSGGLSGRPRRPVGEPLELGAAERVRHRAVLDRDELAAVRQPELAVPDGADAARCRLGHRVGQHAVRPRPRHEPQQARRVQPGDPADRGPRPFRMARRRLLLGPGNQHAQRPLASQRVPEGPHEPEQRVREPGL